MTTVPTTKSNITLEQTQALVRQSKIISEFFRRDAGEEMIASLNILTENYLLAQDLEYVSPEMREHIANQLRVATLIGQLNASHEKVKFLFGNH